MSAMVSQITGVSICLLNISFVRRSKKISRFRVTGHCEGNPPVTGGFPSQGPENISIFLNGEISLQVIFVIQVIIYYEIWILLNIYYFIWNYLESVLECYELTHTSWPLSAGVMQEWASHFCVGISACNGSRQNRQNVNSWTNDQQDFISDATWQHQVTTS